MTDREIRELLVKELAKGDELEIDKDFANLIGVQYARIVAAMRFLESKDYVRVLAADMGSRDSMYCLLPTDTCEAYLSTPDETTVTASQNIFHISGNQPFVAPNSKFDNTTITFNGEVSEVPKEYHEEIMQLIKMIQEASCPKPVQISKLQHFLEKVASSAASGVVGAASTLLLKAALGLPVA